MAQYKPVHLITNDDSLLEKLGRYGLEIECGAEDWTEAEGLHYHYLIRWPVVEERRLSPTRAGAVWWFRRDGCSNCRNKKYNRPCERCGRYYKFIWCAGPDHTNNTRRYIERKIEANPEVNVQWVPTSDDESSDTE